MDANLAAHPVSSQLRSETDGCAGSRAGKLLPLAHGEAAAVRQPGHRRPLRVCARPGSRNLKARGPWLSQPRQGAPPRSPPRHCGPAPLGGRRPGRPATPCGRTPTAEPSHPDGSAFLPQPPAVFGGSSPAGRHAAASDCICSSATGGCCCAGAHAASAARGTTGDCISGRHPRGAPCALHAATSQAAACAP